MSQANSVDREAETLALSRVLPDAQARLVGWLYIGTIFCGLFAEVAVRSKVRADDAATTLLNISQQQSMYRAGEAADLVMLCCYVAITAMLHRLFASTGRSISLVAACFSLIGISVLAVAGLLHLLPLGLLETPAIAGAAEIAQLALASHAKLYGLSVVFFGFYCLLIGWLAISSRLLPGPIGLLMMVGGLTHIIIRFLWILTPATLASIPSPIHFLPLLGEAAFALWLVLFGLRPVSSLSPA